MGAAVYYNEIDAQAAAWLRELIRAGELPAGDVDCRSIVDVRADDLRGYRQAHFFAGIGGWPLALRLADIPTDRSVWTGSCPCQPFSAAGIYGLRGSGSSASARLTACLANRLPAEPAWRGSTMFSLTWRMEATPQRRLLPRLVASALRTSGTARSSWPTPRAEDSESTGAHSGTPDTLHSATQLTAAPWQTPLSIDGRVTQGRTAKFLRGRVTLSPAETVCSPWPTPTAMDSTRGPETNAARLKRGAKTGTTLIDATTWATPAAMDYRHANARSYAERSGSTKGEQLNNQVVHLGTTASGSGAQTAGRGQLNPAFSRWLMGYRAAWCRAAVVAWRLTPTGRRRRA